MKNHSPSNNSSPEEIFVGRDKELQDFIESLDAIIGDKPSIFHTFLPFLKKKAIPVRQKPKVFLYYGEGGFGKSRMTRKCLEIASEMQYMTVLLDWDEYYARRSTLPNTSSKMITALYTVLSEPALGIASFFDDYLKVEKKLNEIADKIERVWKEDASSVVNPIVNLGSTALAAKGIPVPDFAQDFAANTINNLAKEGRKTIIEQLRNAKKMQREELDLYENNEKALTEALVKGLAKASQLHPILLVIDTYEQVDTGADVDDWMRHVFLKSLIHEAPKVCTVLAGRNNHFQEYRNSLPDALLYNRNFDDILFTETEVTKFAKDYEVSLTDEEALLIRAGTAGIPLVVKDTLQLIRDGHDKGQVIKDLDSHTGTVESIIANMVDRFLKYTEHEDWKADRHRCYQIVMLRQFDPDLLREAWGMTPAEFANSMKTFTSRHSFLHPRTHQVHDKVRHFLRKYLISQYRQNTAERPQLQELAANLLSAAAARVQQLETAIPNIGERYADNRYAGALFDRLLSQVWSDSSQLKKIIPGYLVEMLEFAPEIAKSFALQLEDLAPLFPTSQTMAIRTIYQGIHTFETLTFESSSRAPLMPETRLFEYLEKDIDGFSEYQKALFSFLFGKHLIRQTDYDNAFLLLQNAIPALRPNMNEQLCYSLLQLGIALPKSKVETAIFVYATAIELGPSDVFGYHNNLGNALRAQNKLDEAIEQYQKAIKLKPEYPYAYNNLGNALNAQNKPEEAIEQYKNAIKLKPDYALAYTNLGIALKAQNKPEEAIEQYQKAIKLKPDYAHAYMQLGYIYFELSKIGESVLSFSKAANYVEATDFMPNINIAFIKLRLGKLNESKTLSESIWHESGMKEPFSAKNLGHYHLLQQEPEKALEWYRISQPLWEGTHENLFDHLESDYEDLLMSTHGITRIQYDAIIKELKAELK